jgi:hypothetical protein
MAEPEGLGKFADYADKHGIYDILKNMVQDTLIARPDDVLSFFAEHLRMKKGINSR